MAKGVLGNDPFLRGAADRAEEPRRMPSRQPPPEPARAAPLQRGKEAGQARSRGRQVRPRRGEGPRTEAATAHAGPHGGARPFCGRIRSWSGSPGRSARQRRAAHPSSPRARLLDDGTAAGARSPERRLLTAAARRAPGGSSAPSWSRCSTPDAAEPRATAPPRAGSSTQDRPHVQYTGPLVACTPRRPQPTGSPARSTAPAATPPSAQSQPCRRLERGPLSDPLHDPERGRCDRRASSPRPSAVPGKTERRPAGRPVAFAGVPTTAAPPGGVLALARDIVSRRRSTASRRSRAPLSAAHGDLARGAHGGGGRQRPSSSTTTART